MNKRKLLLLGVPPSSVPVAISCLQVNAKNRSTKRDPKAIVSQIVEDPSKFFEDPIFASLAQSVQYEQQFTPPEPADYEVWGKDDIDLAAIKQLENACRVPGAVRAALMPDAHLGYGLPIGGVLATEGCVIPYAVGVDIACRMRLTLTDLDAEILERNDKKECNFLDNALSNGTLFGSGAFFKTPNQHKVMDDDWTVSAVTRENKDRAWRQLGSSGSGNHFAEWGIVEVLDETWGVPKGRYTALLSHSGSRGSGAAVCNRYSSIARQNMPERYRDDKGLSHLAWLSLDSQEGIEYWNAMNLMGQYAAANHEVLHQRVLKLAGAETVKVVENHHNFAWRERHFGKDTIVHRKGATPAAKGVLGVIPGSMADPAFVVRGKGNPASMNSAAHGAGRVMSRRKAKDTFNLRSTVRNLEARGIRVLSAGADEVPGVYKNIEQVMAEQSDLVEMVARFDPKIVKMCGDGSRAED